MARMERCARLLSRGGRVSHSSSTSCSNLVAISNGRCNFVRTSLLHTSAISRQIQLSTPGFDNKGAVRQPTVDAADESFIIRSPYSDVEIPEINLADFVWRNVDQHKERTALVCSMTGRQYTYETAHDTAKKFGSALLRLGAKRGDVMGMVVPNIPEFPIAFLGAAGVDVTLTTMNPTYRPEEIARQLENSGARFVLTIALFLDNIREACTMYDGIEKIIVLASDDMPEDCISFFEMAIFDDGQMYEEVLDNRQTNATKDIAVLPYSSGTTGAPKGVALTHYNMVSNICQMQHPAIDVTDPSKQETTVAVLPFFHIYAMTTIMNCGLQNGFKIVTVPKFEPESYITALATYKPTFLNLVPPLVSFLSTSPLVKPEVLSSVEHVFGGAAPFGPALIEKFAEKVAPNVVVFREGFGMTESSPVTHIQPLENPKLGACGHCAPNTIAKIVDLDTLKPVPQGESGELWVAGPQVMLEYYNNEKATDETIVDGGWLRTGDIAIVDETGQFTIVDRLKELIKVKGLQVAPSEIEDVIRRHPGVNDVAVVGVPDERAGELPRAYVVRKNRSVLEQDIMDWVAERLAPHKKLRAGVMFVDTLPKNQTGKILRRELKAQVFKGSFGY